jgi:DNA-binding response OmpR family regulator
MRILLLEDASEEGTVLIDGLREQDYEIELVHTPAHMTEVLRTRRVHLAVLDVDLLAEDAGRTLAQLTATASHVPVVCLSARTDTQALVAALDAGACDYVIKPFAFAELAARLRARVRQAGTVLRVADVEIDVLGHTVTHAGRPVCLSRMQFDLLLYLMRRAGETVTRPALLEEVWGYPREPQTNIVDVNIGYLRRRLRVDGREAPITTVRCKGYRFER